MDVFLRFQFWTEACLDSTCTCLSVMEWSSADSLIASASVYLVCPLYLCHTDV